MNYKGYKFVLHKHLPIKGSLHLDLRFQDIYSDKLFSFAIPKEWSEDYNEKTLCYKTIDHDPLWLELSHKNLEIVDSGTIDFVVFKPSRYFELDFHGNKINGLKRLFKLYGKSRNDIWLLINK